MPRRATERRRRRPGPAWRERRSSAGLPSPRTPPTGRPATVARARAPRPARPPAAAEAPPVRPAPARADRTERRTRMASVSVPETCRTVTSPPHVRISSASRAVLPIPGSPRSNRERPCPSRSSATSGSESDEADVSSLQHVYKRRQRARLGHGNQKRRCPQGQRLTGCDRWAWSLSAQPVPPAGGAGVHRLRTRRRTDRGTLPGWSARADRLERVGPGNRLGCVGGDDALPVVGGERSVERGSPGRDQIARSWRAHVRRRIHPGRPQLGDVIMAIGPRSAPNRSSGPGVKTRESTISSAVTSGPGSPVSIGVAEGPVVELEGARAEVEDRRQRVRGAGRQRVDQPRVARGAVVHAVGR